MDEPDPSERRADAQKATASLRLGDVWREVLGVIRSHPVAVLLPAAALGAAADLLQVVDRDPATVIALGLGLAILFDLYVAYIERLLMAIEQRPQRLSLGRLTRDALPALPAVFVASLVAIGLPMAATGLLVVPGLWLLTRWSLFAPVISRERVGPVASLRRSNALVRGAFWSVFAAATLSLLVEHAVIHATALEAESLLGSQPWGLVGAAVAVAAVSPFTAVTISVVYSRLRIDRSPARA